MKQAVTPTIIYLNQRLGEDWNDLISPRFYFSDENRRKRSSEQMAKSKLRVQGMDCADEAAELRQTVETQVLKAVFVILIAVDRANF